MGVIGDDMSDEPKRPRRVRTWTSAAQYWWVPILAVLLGFVLERFFGVPDDRPGIVRGSVAEPEYPAVVGVQLGDRKHDVSGPSRRFTFDDVPATTHDLVLKSEGYADTVIAITVRSAKTTAVDDVRLRPVESPLPPTYVLTQWFESTVWSEAPKWTAWAEVHIPGVGGGVRGEDPHARVQLCVNVRDDQQLLPSDPSSVEVSVFPHQNSWGRFEGGPTWSSDKRRVCYEYKSWYASAKTGRIRARYLEQERVKSTRQLELIPMASGETCPGVLERGRKYSADLGDSHVRYVLEVKFADGSPAVLTDGTGDPRVGATRDGDSLVIVVKE